MLLTASMVTSATRLRSSSERSANSPVLPERRDPMDAGVADEIVDVGPQAVLVKLLRVGSKGGGVARNG